MLPLGYFRPARVLQRPTASSSSSSCHSIGVAVHGVTQFFQLGVSGTRPLQAGVRLLVLDGDADARRTGRGHAGRSVRQPPPHGQRDACCKVVGLRLVGVRGRTRASPTLGVGAGWSSPGSGIFPVLPHDGRRRHLLRPPPRDVGVASGTNSALRELGGVFGVAVLAAVFASYGSYASTEEFTAGFRAAMVVAAAVTVGGLVAALLAPGRRAPLPEQRSVVDGFAVVGG